MHAYASEKESSRFAKTDREMGLSEPWSAVRAVPFALETRPFCGWVKLNCVNLLYT